MTETNMMILAALLAATVPQIAFELSDWLLSRSRSRLSRAERLARVSR